MTIKQLQALSRRLFKLGDQLREQSKSDPQAAQFRKELDALWQRVYGAREDKAAAEAERKDKGEVLFTVFDGATLRTTVRTPHRLISTWQHSELSPSVQIRSCPEESFTYDFEYAMKRRSAA